MFLRRLRDPQRSYLTSAVGGLAKGSGKDTIQQGIHLGAVISDVLCEGKTVRPRSIPNQLLASILEDTCLGRRPPSARSPTNLPLLWLSGCV